MAKIGSVQVEITPHISDEVLDGIAQKVAAAVERGVRMGMAAALQPPVSAPYITVSSSGATKTTPGAFSA
jgi:hypothetical protein